MSALPTITTTTGRPLYTDTDALDEASVLRQNFDLALAFPLGASTFRALVVDRLGQVVDAVTICDPGAYYPDFVSALAGVQVTFGFQPAAGAAFLAGPVPRTGQLHFTNLPGWGAFDRDISRQWFDFDIEWFNDGPAGYFGVPLLDQSQFAELRPGGHQDGAAYGYAIFGTGLNMGLGPRGREDGHAPFAARSVREIEFAAYLSDRLGHYPEWEEACSGGQGFRLAAEFLHERTPWNQLGHSFWEDFQAAPEQVQGEVVTAYALSERSCPVARGAAKLVLGCLGTFLGAQAVAAQLSRIDVSGGILGDPALRRFCLQQTNFLDNFVDQGRSQFSAQAQRCGVRVCLDNPEQAGAVARAAQLLRDLVKTQV